MMGDKPYMAERGKLPPLLPGKLVLLFDATLEVRPQAWMRRTAGGHTPPEMADYQQQVYFLIQGARVSQPFVIEPDDKLVLSLLGFRRGAKRIDVDNFAKAILDAGQPNIWPDDKQIIGFRDLFVIHEADRDCIQMLIWRVEEESLAEKALAKGARLRASKQGWMDDEAWKDVAEQLNERRRGIMDAHLNELDEEVDEDGTT